MPIVIRHGAPDALSEFLPGLIAGQNQAQENKRFDLIQKEAERRFMLEEEQNKRREEAQTWERQDRQAQQAQAQEQSQARQAAAGLYAGSVEAPSMSGNIGKDAIKARQFAATQSAVRSLAAVDPDAAQRFLAFREKEMRADAVKGALTGLGSTMGKSMTDPNGGYVVRGMDGNPIEDPTYMERAKQRLQRIDAASQLEPEQAVNEAQQIAHEDQHDRDEIKARTTLNLAKGRKALKANELLAGAAQAGIPDGRLDKAQSIIVGLESGDYDKDLASFQQEFSMALEGKVIASIGGVKVPVDEDWFKQYQAAQVEKMSAQVESERALAEQRRAGAVLSGKKGDNLSLPGGRNGKESNPLATDESTARILRSRFGDRAPENADAYDKEKARLEAKAKGPDSKERIAQDIKAGNATGSEAQTRAKALGLSFEDIKAALGK